jgi:hypothetical protein
MTIFIRGDTWSHAMCEKSRHLKYLSIKVCHDAILFIIYFVLIPRHDNLNMSQEIDHHKHNQILKLISSIGNIFICVDAIHLILYRWYFYYP